ncbi:type VI secretion system domain-containing protein, partial [Escherichia coli]|nr:type VI secretion system domain-containing protein [Escherichia coli]
ARRPSVITLLYNERTPFVSEQKQQWLASSGSVKKYAPLVQTDEELQAAKACFDENGLEAALRYLENLPEGDPRHQFHRQFFGAQLLEEAGMVQLAQQQYRMLFRT